MSTTAAPNVAGAVETVASHLHPTPSWEVADHPRPTGLEEIWRFTPLKRLEGLLAEGGTLPGLTWEGETPEGVEFTLLPIDELPKLAVEPPVDRVAALAVARSAELALMRIPAETELEQANVHVGTGNGGEAAEVFVLEVGANARATIVFHYKGSGSYAAKYDIRVGDGAEINLVFVNDWEADARHGGQISLEVGRDARVRTVQASLGGDVIRLQENARFAGPGGELKQYGLYFVDAGQHVQHRLFVDHNAPKTKSNVDYRGALQGKGAHAVWIGDVLIRKAAEDIDTYESNKNLLLTEGCKADSVPNLEIETGEIAGAGHSSSTGRFDELQLFYLMSRGVEEREARRLIVHGFFWEIIRQIGVADIEQRLLARVEQELELLEDSQA